MKRLFAYLRPFMGRMSVGLAIKIAGTLVELALPYILGMILNEIIKDYALSGDTEGGLRSILIWGGVMAVCAVAALVFNIVANRMAAYVAKDVATAIRHDLFDATMRLSCAQADGFTVPSLESRLTSDTYNVHHFIGMMQRIGIRAPLLLLGGILITLILDAHLALVMIAVLPFLAMFVVFISKKTIPLYAEVQKNVDGMVRVVREDSQGIRVIKALSKKNYERKRFDNANRKLVKTEKKVGYITALSNPIMQVCMNMGLVGVVLLGAHRVNADLTQAGKIIAFIQYFTLISTSMMVLSRIFMAYSKGVASANRIGEVIDMRNEILPCAEEDFPSCDNDLHICFEGVSFGYHQNKHVLHDISFGLKKGQTLGIIGATGSGKSTLIQLLMRFYDVGEGSVKINGRDVRTIDKDELHSMFGVALQNDFLFNGSYAAGIIADQLVDKDIPQRLHLLACFCFLQYLYTHLTRFSFPFTTSR